MKSKISEAENCIIDIRKNYLSNEHMFSTKMFFTLLSIFIGFVYLIIKDYTNSATNEGPFLIIILGIMIFILQMYKTSSNLKRMCNGMIRKIIISKKLEDYLIEKDDFWDKALVSLTGAYFLFVLIIIISKSLFWSFIISLAFAIFLFFSKVNYRGE